jgi:cobalt/nickel transport system ATP-binding protein
MPPAEAEMKAIKALERVGSAHLRARPPYSLSGGEKRCVAIAGVLAMSPDILVLDEPSSNLDPLARQRLIDLLQTFEHTKIIATHDLDLALDVCERIIVLHNGVITADGQTMNIFQDINLLSGSGLARPLKMQGCPVCSRV